MELCSISRRSTSSSELRLLARLLAASLLAALFQAWSSSDPPFWSRSKLWTRREFRPGRWPNAGRNSRRTRKGRFGTECCGSSLLKELIEEDHDFRKTDRIWHSRWFSDTIRKSCCVCSAFRYCRFLHTCSSSTDPWKHLRTFLLADEPAKSINFVNWFPSADVGFFVEHHWHTVATVVEEIVDFRCVFLKLFICLFRNFKN